MKFVSMLHASVLHFARLDTLGDSHEGVPPKLVLQQLFGSIDWQAVADGGRDPEFIRQEIEASWFTQTREMGYANCWHMNEDESTAMWNVYSGEGLAIQSTYRRLRDSFAAERQRAVHIGEVAYVDFQQEEIPDFRLGAVLYKRKAFAWEREIRAVHLDTPKADPDGVLLPRVDPSPRGISVAVDLDVLIEAVHVAPGRPGWFVTLVQEMLNTFHLPHKPTRASTLDTSPLYFNKDFRAEKW